MTPQQCLDSFQFYGWLEDGNIDWVDMPFPEDVEILFSKAEEKKLATREEVSSEDAIGDVGDDDDDDDDGDFLFEGLSDNEEEISE